MQQFIGIFFIVAAVYLMTIPFLLNTSGRYTLIFKIVPFAVGLASVFLALHHYGFIIQIG